MVDEKNPILNPQAEGSNTTSSSNLNWDKFFSKEEAEKYKKLYELESEIRKLQREINNELEDIEARQKRGEITTKEETKRTREKNDFLKSLLIKHGELENELGIYESDSDFDSEEEESENELSVITTGGTEVIKAEISQELEKVKNSLESVEISDISIEKINEELKDKVLELHERLGNEAEISLMMTGGLFTSNETLRNKRKEKAEKVATALSKPLILLIENSVKDLNDQKKKAVKKINKLIEARNKEVFEAKDAIAKFESVIEGLKLQNSNQREKSDREISKLQEGIKELNSQLKEYREKEANAQKFFNKQKEAQRKRMMEADNNVNRPIQDNQEKIKRLQDYIDSLEISLKLAEDSRDQRTKELEGEKKAHETTKKNAEADLEAEQKEHNTTKKAWGEKYNRLKTAKEDLEKRKKQIEDEKNRLDLENVDLKVENKKLKEKREKAEAEARKWKSEYESEKALHEPTWIQKGMKFLGVEKLQNAIATSASIAGCFVILWGISWMWKNVIKETWKNFKGEPEDEPRPQRKEKVRYTDYEEISETKEKSQSLLEKQPTIIINNSTPTEKEPNQPVAISNEPVKQEEFLTQISSEKETLSIEKKNESKKKKKNKKKVKGDGS